MFDGNDYAYWKVRMRVFLKSLDEKVWLFVENGLTKPATLVDQWYDEQIDVANYNSKAMNAIYNGVSSMQFKKISNVEVAKTSWTILEATHERTKEVKINKLQQLTTKFENIKMSEDESFDDF